MMMKTKDSPSLAVKYRLVAYVALLVLIFLMTNSIEAIGTISTGGGPSPV